jgi:hypothetical protein
MTLGPPQRSAIPRRIALGWFSLTTLAFWLPTIRGAFDGRSYEWGLVGLGGRGMGGDYWLPLVASLVAIWVTAGSWRGRRWAFWVMAVWGLLLTLALSAYVATSDEDFRLQGDTLGIDVSLRWVGPIVFAAATVLTLVAATGVHSRTERSPTSNWLDRPWLVGLALALPIQFALLRFGDPGSTLDQLGVLLTIAQWFVIGRIFTPEDERPLAG